MLSGTYYGILYKLKTKVSENIFKKVLHSKHYLVWFLFCAINQGFTQGTKCKYKWVCGFWDGLKVMEFRISLKESENI